MTDEAATDEHDMAGQNVASRGGGDCFVETLSNSEHDEHIQCDVMPACDTCHVLPCVIQAY